MYPPVAGSKAIVVVGVDAGWKRLELTCQHALVEPSVARPHDGPAVLVSFSVSPRRGDIVFHV